MKGNPAAILGFALVGLVQPGLLAIRFVILGPVGLVCPPWQRILETYFSSYTINPAYTRRMNDSDRRELWLSQVWILVFWSAAIASAWAGWLPWRVFAIWYGILAAICVVSNVRTLFSHHYDSEGHALGRAAQVMDSIDTPGAWWTELWAPVGFRYHALHHLAPHIPYHNMGRAYRRLKAVLPSDAVYRASTSPGTWASFRALWRG